jgi:hypothetical protein
LSVFQSSAEAVEPGIAITDVDAGIANARKVLSGAGNPSKPKISPGS